MTLPSVTIQSYLVFTAVNPTLTPTITLTNGALAGNEVVTVSGQAITIQIQNGTSTMADMVAAVNAQVSTSGYSASQLVTVSAGAHGSTTVTANDGFALSGGTLATYASVVVNGILFTASSSGTGSNGLSVEFTTGATAGSEVVTDPNSNGTPLSIQIEDAGQGVDYEPLGGDPADNSDYTPLGTFTTVGDLITAITAWQTSNTVYFTMTPQVGLDTPVYASNAASPVSLAGGLAAAVASTGAVNGVTVVSATTGPTLNGKTVSYTTGATAGSEVVSLDGNSNVFVQIQSGVSTVTQIVTALEASTAFTALYTASGLSSATPLAEYQIPLTGAVTGPLGALGFYADASSVTLTTTYQYLTFNNVMNSISIANTETSGSDVLSFSWDGINVHGLLAAAQAVSFEIATKSGIYVKYVTGSPTFQIFASSR